MSGPGPRVVALHGAPRSGTTWAGSLFDSSPSVAYRYQPFFSHAFRGRVGQDAGPGELAAFFDALFASEDPFVHQVGAGRIAREPFPAFGKAAPTHLVYKEVRFHQYLPMLLEKMPDLRAIGLVRDPRAMLASWMAAPREFDPTWSPTSEWRHAPAKNAGLTENWYGFERWKALAECFLSLESACPRFQLTRYEDLARAPEAVTRRMFAFAGLDMTAQTISFIAASTARDDGDPYGVHRSHGARHGPGSLPPGIGEEICAELRGTPLERFLA